MGTHHTGIPLSLRNIQPPLTPVTSISINKVITGELLDSQTFHINLIGDNGFNASGVPITQTQPLLFQKLQYGTYTVTESTSFGYVLTSITPATFILSADNPQQIVEIVNQKLCGTVTITKEVTGEETDETYFDITITGQGVDPIEQSGQVRVGEPLVFYDLPLDNYYITETAILGYSLTSITPDYIAIDVDNLTFDIEIINEKLVAPVIADQSFTVIDRSDNGTSVGTVIATSPDSLIYEIVSGNTDDVFRINSSTGELVVDDNHGLDMSVNPVFSLVIRATDFVHSELYAEGDITITLLTAIKYGALYNFPAASKNGGTGVGSIAPDGCHVPSASEYGILVTELGGEAVAGGHLKEVGIFHWVSESAGTDNSSGFNLRGSGKRFGDTGTFTSINIMAMLWNTTIYYNIYYTLDYTDSFNNSSNEAYNGLGVRCILDSPETWTPGYTITDIDGNVYPTVKIGNQVWMAANLAVTHFNDGTPIPNVTGNSEWTALTSSGYCWYDNNINNK